MIKIRASSTPLVMKCAASSITPDPVIESAGELAVMGNAVHWAFKQFLDDTVDDELDLDEYATDFGVDRDELGWLWFKTTAVWFDVEEFFPNPVCEKPLEFIDRENGIHLTGTPDVVCWVGRELRIADLKTGFLDGDWSDQVKAYAFLAMVNEPAPTGDEAPGGAYTVVLRARERTTDGEMYTREQLTAWYQSLVQKLKNQHVYNPDPESCRRCKRGHTCPAKTALIRQAVDSLELEDAVGFNQLPEDLVVRATLLGQLYQRAKLVADVAEKTKGLIKAEVQALGGRAPMGNGFDLVINTVKPKKIITNPGFKLLAEKVGYPDALACVTINKGDAEDAIKARSLPKQKGKDVAAFLQELQEQGAISETIQERLEIRKSEVPQITNEAAAV